MRYFSLRSQTLLLGLFLFSVLNLSLSAAPARAQDGYTGPGRYEIENAASGKLLEMNRQDGRTVQQWTRDKHRSQLWDILDAGDGYIYIRCAENGMSLDIQGGAHDGARVILAPASGADTQMWMIEHGGDNLVRFTSRLGRAMDLAHGSRLDGAVFETWEKISQNNQRFRLIRIADLRVNDVRVSDVRVRDSIFPRREDVCSAVNAFGEKGSYELGYCSGADDFRAQLRRSFGRHRERFDRRWDEAFIEGYYDGYDAGHTETASMRLEERDAYSAGFRLGQQDQRDGKRPDYSRHSGRFDTRAEQNFRRGYQNGFYSGH